MGEGQRIPLVDNIISNIIEGDKFTNLNKRNITLCLSNTPWKINCW